MPGSPAKASRRQLKLVPNVAQDTQLSSSPDAVDVTRTDSWQAKKKKVELRSKSVDQLDNAQMPDMDLPEMQLGLDQAGLKGGFDWRAEVGVFGSSDDDMNSNKRQTESEEVAEYHLEDCPSSDDASELVKDPEQRPKGSVSRYLSDVVPQNVNEVGMTSCLVGTIEKLNISTELQVDMSAPPSFEHPHYECLPTVDSDKKSTSSADKGLDVLQVLLGGSTNKLSPGSNSSWQLFPSTDSMKSISVSLNSSQDPDLVEEHELGLVLICTGKVTDENLT